MFPHDGNIVTIDQLTYYDPKGSSTPEHVLPTISLTIDNVSIPSFSTIVPGLFSNTLTRDTFLFLQPLPTPTEVSYYYTVTSSTILTTSQPQSQPQH